MYVGYAPSWPGPWPRGRGGTRHGARDITAASRPLPASSESAPKPKSPEEAPSYRQQVFITAGAPRSFKELYYWLTL